MEITREALETRRNALLASIEKMKVSLETITANIRATDGAAQECDFWLAQLDAQTAPAPVEIPAVNLKS